MRTGRSDLAPLDRVDSRSPSGLLLHDMGPELDDGYTEGRATSAEMTHTRAALEIGSPSAPRGHALPARWSRAYAARDRSARWAGGASRAAFNALSAADQERVLRYLRSL